jgi:hypothetical protein
LSDGDDLASTLVEKFGEAATSAAVNQVAATAIPETGGVFDILRNITMAFLLARITTLTASILIPAGAKELEKECLESCGRNIKPN